MNIYGKIIILIIFGLFIGLSVIPSLGNTIKTPNTLNKIIHAYEKEKQQ